MGRKHIIGIIIGLMLVLGIAGVVGVFVVAPSVAKSEVEKQLQRIAERTGLTVETEKIETLGMRGVRIQGLKVTEKGSEIVYATTIDAAADVWSIIRGNRNLDTVVVQGVRVNLHLDATGKPHLLDRLKREKQPTDQEPMGESTSRLDQIPSLEAKDVVIAITSDAQGFPLRGASVTSAGWSWDGDELTTHAQFSVDVVEDNTQFKVPTSIEMNFVFNQDMRPIKGGMEFDGTLAVTDLGPLPFLGFGVTGVHITEAGGVQAQGLTVNQGEHVIVAVKNAELRFESLQDLRNGKVTEVIIEEPLLNLEFDKTGSGPVINIHDVLRQPAARAIANSARIFAQGIAARKKDPLADVAEEDVLDSNDPPIADDEVAPDWLARLPAVVRITNATVKGTDARDLPLLNHSSQFSLDDGNFEFVNTASSGDFKMRGGFRATASATPRGKVDFDLTAQFIQRTINGTVDIDALDLSWLGQILGPRLAEVIRGGILRSKLSFESGKSPQSFDVKGMLSVEKLAVFHPLIAEDVIDGITASYTFDAHYDARMDLPPAKLILVPPYKDDIAPDGKKLPSKNQTPKGGFFVRAGKAEFNKVAATFRPAIYGFNAPGKWPTRFDLTIELPETPVQTLVDAVPKVIQGPIYGTKINGSFAWMFALEIPMYRASDMVWNANPILKDISLLQIPDAVDVRKLMTPMTMTITDSIKEEDDFSKTIRLAAPTPYPASWLTEHAGLTLQQIDERNRRRGWPEIPSSSESGLPHYVIDSADYWLTPYALNQAARPPWSDDDVIQRRPESPYGPYVFAPLVHISPYLPKAVMTTEDSSFFTNSGFNMHALRASIEENLTHGRFKRGASTIAMQMVKNVFLDRKKLLVRKIREAFLVFLMETVVDIPKERIMEVYLNVIEFGPGIFGIHEASLHYFGKRPDELTLGEVAWFASIIPSPKRYHVYWERGRITDQYFTRMKRYIQVMHSRERITAEELQQATQAPPEFYKPTADEPVVKPKPVTPMFFAPFDPDLVPQPPTISPFAP